MKLMDHCIHAMGHKDNCANSRIWYWTYFEKSRIQVHLNNWNFHLVQIYLKLVITEQMRVNEYNDTQNFQNRNLNVLYEGVGPTKSSTHV